MITIQLTSETFGASSGTSIDAQILQNTMKIRFEPITIQLTSGTFCVLTVLSLDAQILQNTVEYYQEKTEIEG